MHRFLDRVAIGSRQYGVEDSAQVLQPLCIESQWVQTTDTTPTVVYMTDALDNPSILTLEIECLGIDTTGAHRIDAHIQGTFSRAGSDVQQDGTTYSIYQYSTDAGLVVDFVYYPLTEKVGVYVQGLDSTNMTWICAVQKIQTA